MTSPEELERRAARGDMEAAERYAKWLIDSGRYVKYGGAPLLHSAAARAAWDAGRFFGVNVLSDYLSVYVDGDSEDLYTDPPVLVKARARSNDDVLRENCDGWIDPTWEVEIVHPRRELAGTSSVWANAPGYCDEGERGKVECLHLWVPRELAGGWHR